MKKILIILTSILLFLSLLGCKKDSQKYLITINYNNGENSKIMLVDSLEEPNSPTREGYTFKEWISDGKKFEFKNEYLKDNLIIDATWTKNEEVNPEIQYFTVSFETDSDDNLSDIKVKKNSSLIGIYPTKSNNLFLGWYLDSNLTKSYDLSLPVTSNLKLYAKWIKQPSTDKTIKITLKFGFDFPDQEIEIPINSRKEIKNNNNMENYSFMGWSFKEDLSDLPNNLIKNYYFTHDTTLYARYYINNITPTIEINDDKTIVKLIIDDIEQEIVEIILKEGNNYSFLDDLVFDTKLEKGNKDILVKTNTGLYYRLKFSV